MTDFSPYATRVAAQEAFNMIKAGQLTFDAEGCAEISLGSLVVRIAVYDEGEPSIRVIDANGRHWFPDVKAIA